MPEIERGPPFSPFRKLKSAWTGRPAWAGAARQPPLHLVEEEGLVAVGAVGRDRGGARARRQPQLGHRAEHLDLHAADLLAGHGPLAGDPPRVGGERGALDATE